MASLIGREIAEDCEFVEDDVLWTDHLSLYLVKHSKTCVVIFIMQDWNGHSFPTAHVCWVCVFSVNNGAISLISFTVKILMTMSPCVVWCVKGLHGVDRMRGHIFCLKVCENFPLTRLVIQQNGRVKNFKADQANQVELDQ